MDYEHVDLIPADELPPFHKIFKMEIKKSDPRISYGSINLETLLLIVLVSHAKEMRYDKFLDALHITHTLLSAHGCDISYQHRNILSTLQNTPCVRVRFDTRIKECVVSLVSFKKDRKTRSI
jgi:hypothetical protein